MASPTKEDMLLIPFSSVSLILVRNSVRFLIFAKSKISFISDFVLRDGSSRKSGALPLGIPAL